MKSFTQNNLKKSLLLGVVLLTSQGFAQEAKMNWASNATFNDYQSGISRVEKNEKINFVNRKGNEVSPIK